jgi:hypothetical protein
MVSAMCIFCFLYHQIFLNCDRSLELINVLTNLLMLAWMKSYNFLSLQIAIKQIQLYDGILCSPGLEKPMEKYELNIQSRYSYMKSYHIFVISTYALNKWIAENCIFERHKPTK